MYFYWKSLSQVHLVWHIKNSFTDPITISDRNQYLSTAYVAENVWYSKKMMFTFFEYIYRSQMKFTYVFLHHIQCVTRWLVVRIHYQTAHTFPDPWFNVRIFSAKLEKKCWSKRTQNEAQYLDGWILKQRNL